MKTMHGFSLCRCTCNNAIEELKTSSENSNARKSTILLVGVFKKWAALRRHGDIRDSRT
jgi:hypothetical protein